MTMEDKQTQPFLTTSKIVPLWVMVFFNGWFIMQTELAGARSLTPYFGNSIFVWGSVLAVFMLALAVGYGAGGRLTRRYDSHWPPVFLLVVAGVLVAVSTLYQEPLCARLATSMDVRWGALLATVLLYALPMILSGAISPYSVHLATGARSEAGSRAGTLYAVSTVGSFLGCLATSFVLIPSYSLQIVAVGGGVLVILTAVMAGICLPIATRSTVAISLVFSGIVLVAGLYAPQRFESTEHQVYAKMIVGERLSDDDPSTLDARLAESQRLALAELARYATDEGPKVILKTETAYHRVAVTQEGPIRKLTFGEPDFKVSQASMNMSNILIHHSEYTEMMLAPILYKQNPKRVLVIGLGGGDVTRGIETCYPDVEMDVVEIDPAVVRIAQDYFFWKPSSKVKVYTMDGRTFVGMQVVNNAKPYDWVIIDAFDSDYVPFHLTTAEFFDILGMVMAADGVVSVNVWINHKLFSYQARTINAIFGQLDAYFGKRSGNVVLVAQKGAMAPMNPGRAAEAMKSANLREGAAVDLRYIISCLLPKPNWVEEGDILTDTWAPVESLMKED